MISSEEAATIAKLELVRYSAESESESEIELALISDATIERPTCFVFFWNSKKYIETGDFQTALGGNAPILVDRRNRSVHTTGTAHPIEHYIKEFEERTHG